VGVPLVSLLFPPQPTSNQADPLSITELDRMLESDPNNVLALIEQGESKLKLTKFEAAIEDFTMVLDIDNSQPQLATLDRIKVLDLRSHCYKSIEKWDAAITDLKKMHNLVTGLHRQKVQDRLNEVEYIIAQDQRKKEEQKRQNLLNK
jgi:lipopolysaccharide biosynthesis regulator YciM